MRNEMNNFSIMSYSFHGLHNVGAMNLFGYLETLRYRYHLRNADIWNGFLDSYDDDYLETIRLNLLERDLTLVNLCCDYCHIWDEDPEVRAANEITAWKCIHAAEVLGAKTIRIDLGVREDRISSEQLRYAASKYDEYCQAAAKFGAKLGTENHWGATFDPDSLERLFEAVSAENFGMLLHLGNWSVPDEEKDELDRRFASRAMHIHLDYEHCVDAHRHMIPLREAGYTGCWSVESHKSTNEYNNVAVQLAHVKQVLAPMEYEGGW